MKECVNNDQLFDQSPGAVFNSQKTFFRHKKNCPFCLILIFQGLDGKSSR